MALEVFPSTARQFAGALMIGNLKVVEYPGYDGRTQFLLNLRIKDGCITFDVEPGVGYYARRCHCARILPGSSALERCRVPAGVFDDSSRLRALYRSGAITLRNHAELILPILTYSCPDYCNCLT